MDITTFLGPIVKLIGTKGIEYRQKKKTDRKIFDAFASGMINYIRACGYNDTIIEDQLHTFVNQANIKEAIINCYDLINVNASRRILTNQLEITITGSVDESFDFKQCVEHGFSRSQNEVSFLQRAFYQNTSSEQAKPKVFSIPQYHNYIDFDNKLSDFIAFCSKHKHVLLSGIHGSGKSFLVAQFAYFNGTPETIWIDCENIMNHEEVLHRLCMQIGIEPHNDYHQTTIAVQQFTESNQDIQIIIDGIEIGVLNELLYLLPILPCKIVIASTETGFADFKTYNLDSLSLSAARSLYQQQLVNIVIEKADWEYIDQIINLAGHHPLFISLLARLNSMLHCSSSELLTRLLRSEDMLFNELPVAAQQNSKWKEATIKGHIHTIFKFGSPLSEDEEMILRLLEFLPYKPIPTCLIQRVFHNDSLKSLALNKLIRRGILTTVQLASIECITYHYLLRGLVEVIDCDDYDTNLIFTGISENFMEPYCYDDKTPDIILVVDVFEFLYIKLSQLVPDQSTEFISFIFNKASLLYHSALYRTAINECLRVLEITKSIKLEQSTRVLLANAYASHEDVEMACEILASINLDACDENLKNGISEVEEKVLVLRGDYNVIADRLLDHLASESDRDKVSTYQGLATMNYYMRNLETALMYCGKALVLVDKLEIASSTTASMIYTAQSAILLDLKKTKSAIDSGIKGLCIAYPLFGKAHNHTLVSINNLANARFSNKEFKRALTLYTEFLKFADEVYFSNSKLVVHASGQSIICRVFIERAIDRNAFKNLMQGYSNNPERYGYLINLFLTGALRAVEMYDMDTLNKLLCAIRLYAYAKTDYIHAKESRRMINKFDIILDIGSRLFVVSHDALQRTEINVSMFEEMWHEIANGRFDHLPTVEQLEGTHHPSWIPIYIGTLLLMNPLKSQPIIMPRARRVPPTADFGYKPYENSLKPLADENNIVWFQRTQEIDSLDIGLFELSDGCVVCRQFVLGKSGCSLRKLDKDKPSLEFKNDVYSIIGKVIV